jgi:hypothetical protein
MTTADYIVAWLGIACAAAFCTIILVSTGLILWDSHLTSKRAREMQRQRERERRFLR